MEVNAALAIAHGLTHTQTLDNIDISSNPIGKLGMKMIMEAMNNNQHTKFTIDLKDISADKEIQLKDNAFDPFNPEGNVSLDLSEFFG